jgi:tetratricopeptide (TPR) repeat protein
MAHRELDLLVKQHPHTPAAARAAQLAALIEANREDNYGPLRLFFAAVGARERADHAAVLQSLDQLIARYPRAALVPEAVLMRAEALEALRRLDDAIAAYAELPARAPRSPLVPRALLGQARAAEARDGAQPHVAGLYRQVVARHPGTPEGAEAQKRLAALAQNLDNIPRVFRRADVRPFAVVRQGYFDRRDRYEIHIQVADTIVERQLEATLEDALIKHAGDRRDRAHEVRVAAFFPNSRDRIGDVTWALNRRARYDLDLDDARKIDLWRDILKDVLR